MADIEDTIISQNLKIENERLDQEIPRKTAQLSKTIADAKSELLAIKQEEEQTKKDTKEKLNNFAVEKKAHEDRLSDIKLQHEEISRSHNDLTGKVKQSTKELSRLNSQVLSATNELETLLGNISEGNEKLATITELVLKAEILKETVKSLEDRRNSLLLEISTKIEQSEGILKASKEQADIWEHIAEKKKDEANESESRKEQNLKELYQNLTDYQIIKARIETAWDKTFPELEIPL